MTGPPLRARRWGRAGTGDTTPRSRRRRRSRPARLDLGEARGELALADVAPRAHDVGPHLDGHRRAVGVLVRDRRHVRHGMRLSSVAMVGAADPAPRTSRRRSARRSSTSGSRSASRHAVIAPGSRSTPMALALTDRREMRVHVVHDERSAAFVALGLGLDGGPGAAAVHERDCGGQLLPGGGRGGALRGPDDRAHRRSARGAARRRRTADHRSGRPVRTPRRVVRDPGVPDDAERSLWRELASMPGRTRRRARCS